MEQGIEQVYGDFSAAMVRAVRTPANHDEVRRAVGELYSATYLMHELLKERSQEYRDALRAGDDGRTVRALIFVRGASQHRGLTSFTRRGVMPIPGSMIGRRWAWLPTDQVRDLLPNPKTTKPADVQRQHELVELYDRHLADRTVLQTFDLAGDLFRRVSDPQQDP